MEYPKISEVLEMLQEVDNFDTQELRFANGESEIKHSIWINIADYLLTVLYLSGLGYFIYWLIKSILTWLSIL